MREYTKRLLLSTLFELMAEAVLASFAADRSREVIDAMLGAQLVLLVGLLVITATAWTGASTGCRSLKNDKRKNT